MICMRFMLPVAGLRPRNMQIAQPLPLTPPLPSLMPDLRPQRTAVQAVGVGQVFKYMLLGECPKLSGAAYQGSQDLVFWER